MARGRQVTIQFIGDARSLISATNASGKATSTLGSRFKALGKTAAIGAGVATIALAKGLWEVTEAAVADELAAKKLALQLKNTTGATNAQIASVEQWITAQSKALGVTDDELRPALSKLATATGDVTKAQSLLSVAMDVSAGTGKSLDAVTSALQKGVNGSVGGLSRLGVKTKDAAGETKSFDAILGDLTKNFQGQAAKAADTTSGKFERLKVNMSELGEEIGYKVLPYATDFGDWLLKKGVPAAEDMAHWVGDELGPVMGDLSGFIRDNSNELKEFADGAGRRAVDALEVMVDTGEGAVKFFTALPAPVKDLGIHAGVAALVLPRLAAGLTSAGVAAATAGTQVKGFATGLTVAETRSGKLGKGLLTLAGVGGMVAISKGAEDGSQAVGVLGGALSGAFVGGTLGSAIPGVGTAIGAVGGAAVGTGIGLWKMKRAEDAAGSAAGEAKTQADAYADTLDTLTGATTRLTREKVLQRLEEQELIGAARVLGIDTSTLINATLGNHKAIGKVTAAYRDQTGIVEKLQAGKLADFINAEGFEFQKAQRKVKEHNAALDGTDKSARRANEALAKVGKDRPRTDRWAKEFDIDLRRTADNADKQGKAISTLLAAATSGARADMGPFSKNLKKQLGGTTTDAGRAGENIGGAIKSGVNRGLSGIISDVASAAAQALAAGIAAAQGGKGGKGKGKGGRIGAGFGADAADRAEFASSFQFGSSVFGMSGSDEAPLTMESIMAASGAEKAKAEKAKADMAKLLSMGLSAAMVKQFQAQGESGIEALGVLASGASAEQIAQLNAQSAATTSAYGGLGELGAGAVFGSSGFDPANQFDTPFGGHGPRGGKGGGKGQRAGDTYNITINGALDPEAVGAQVEKSLRRRERSTGRKLLATPA